MQKGYGRTPTEMLLLDSSFQWKLGRFTFDQVLSAIERYTDVKSDIPAPSDIIQILDPEPEPLSQAVYVKICKEYEQTPYLPPEKLAYKAEFERREMAKVRIK